LNRFSDSASKCTDSNSDDLNSKACSNLLLGSFFTPRKRLGLVQKASGGPRERIVRCRHCREELNTAACPWLLAVKEQQLCRACREQELAWLRVRCWVCLHVLVVEQRAFPRFEPDVVEPCTSWDEDGAAERAVLASNTGNHVTLTGPRCAWCALAARVVQLPSDLLARVLAFAHDGAGEVFAPPQVPVVLLPVRQGHERKPHRCCHFLFSQGSCLHGYVVGGRHHRTIACWYCSRTFPADMGTEELHKHGEAEHAADISVWLRKKRKAKAKQQRDAYRASPLWEARRAMDLERRLCK